LAFIQSPKYAQFCRACIVLILLLFAGRSSLANIKSVKSIFYEPQLIAEFQQLESAMLDNAQKDNRFRIYFEKVTGPGSFPTPYSTVSVSEGSSIYSFQKSYGYSGFSYDLIVLWARYHSTQRELLTIHYLVNGKQHTYSRNWIDLT